MRYLSFLLLALLFTAARAAEIHTAVRSGDLKKVQSILVANPSEINSQDHPFRSTPLHLAAHGGQSGIAAFLIERGANVEARDVDDSTPIFRAALMGKADIIKMLLEAGANPNAVAKGGTRPIHLAVLNDNLNAVQVLLDSGADVNVRDARGFTPMILSKYLLGNNMKRMLESHGAK